MVKVLTVADIEIPAPNTDKGRFTYIKNAIIAYGNAKVKVHVAACMAVLWTAETGDATYVRTFHDAISEMKGEGDKFRTWVGEVTSFEHKKDGTDEVERKSWLGFNKERGGFFVKNGEVFTAPRELFRKETALEGRKFYERAESAKKTPDQEAALTTFSKMYANATKKAENNGYTLSPALRLALAEVERIAKQELLGNVVHLPVPQAQEEEEERAAA